VGCRGEVRTRQVGVSKFTRLEFQPPRGLLVFKRAFEPGISCQQEQRAEASWQVYKFIYMHSYIHATIYSLRDEQS